MSLPTPFLVRSALDDRRGQGSRTKSFLEGARARWREARQRAKAEAARAAAEEKRIFEERATQGYHRQVLEQELAAYRALSETCSELSGQLQTAELEKTKEAAELLRATAETIAVINRLYSLVTDYARIAPETPDTAPGESAGPRTGS